MQSQSQPTFLNELLIVHIGIIREALGLSQLAGFADREGEKSEEEEEHDQLRSLGVTWSQWESVSPITICPAVFSQFLTISVICNSILFILYS